MGRVERDGDRLWGELGIVKGEGWMRILLRLLYDDDDDDDD